VVLNRTRHLWQYVLVPILVNLLVGILLYVGLLFVGWQAINNVVATLPEWATFLSFVLQAVLVVVLFVVLGFVLLRFGIVLGSPWYSQLAEQLEHIYLPQQARVAPSSHPLTVARDIGEALLFELKKLLLFFGIWLPLLLFNFVPVVGTLVVSVGSVALGVTILCLDFFDSSLSRRRLTFRHKLRIIRESLPASGGFGLVCLALVSVPLLNLLAIPLCVAAGTLFFCDRIAPRLHPLPSPAPEQPAP
jgi:CysZ protein